jgi:hypothetical protein
VRPKRAFLEVCIFLRRGLTSPLVRRVDQASKSKVVNFVQIRHRDQVEAPFTDWLREAYDLQDKPRAKAARSPGRARAAKARPAARARPAAKTKRKSRSRT